jgi:hypothetical protein
MRLLDANLLMYATFDVFPAHTKAREWLDRRLNDDLRVGIPWESVTAFVRLASNPRVLQPCLSVKQAWGQAQVWLACENVWTPVATPRHQEILNALLPGYGITHKHVADAQLAALALGHGLILCSADADFKRFSNLRYENPLIE